MTATFFFFVNVTIAISPFYKEKDRALPRVSTFGNQHLPVTHVDIPSMGYVDVFYTRQ